MGFKFAVVGCGQAGGRIAGTFANLGYRRVVAINTTPQDMDGLPEHVQKLDIGGETGAGKDPARAAAIVASRDEQLFSLFAKAFVDPDYILVAFAAGGGTGAGIFAKTIEVARRYMVSIGKPPRVGVVVAMPKDAEGERPAVNAVYSFKALQSLGPVSPVLFVDNDKLARRLANAKATQEKAISNAMTVEVLHRFNQVAGMRNADVGGATFDRADFEKLLDSGCIQVAAAKVENWTDGSELSEPIRTRLEDGCLATLDLSQGHVAGLLYGLSPAAQDMLTVSQLDSATAAMTRLMGNAKRATTVFQGVFPMTGEGMRILAMIGGLGWPRSRLEKFMSVSRTDRDALAELLGV